MSKAVADYTVVEGDSLSLIAGRLWTNAVYESNKDVIGDDPGHIEPGQRLRLPGCLTVEVEAGDTLTSITEAWLWPHLYAANHATVGVDPDVIQPGMSLRVPDLFK